MPRPLNDREQDIVRNTVDFMQAHPFDEWSFEELYDYVADNVIEEDSDLPPAA